MPIFSIAKMEYLCYNIFVDCFCADGVYKDGICERQNTAYIQERNKTENRRKCFEENFCYHVTRFCVAYVRASARFL